MIISVDFDGTLSLNGCWPEPGEPNLKLIDYIKKRRKNGGKIILWTCRTEKDLEIALAWCDKQELEFDAINDNLPEVVEYWGINSRKIECDIYIDDKAVWNDLYERYPIVDTEE